MVISAKSTVSLASLQQALGNWTTVSAATSVNVTGIHISCISAERADVAGRGYAPQSAAWRLGGCLKGNEMSLSGDEDHVRIWHQPVAGSRYGAWFIAASYETMCLVRDGKLQTATANKAYAVLHPGSAYHCVDGGPGSITTSHPSGYDDAAAAFSAAVATAAKAHGWHLTQPHRHRPPPGHRRRGQRPVRPRRRRPHPHRLTPPDPAGPPRPADPATPADPPPPPPPPPTQPPPSARCAPSADSAVPGDPTGHPPPSRTPPAAAPSAAPADAAVPGDPGDRMSPSRITARSACEARFGSVAVNAAMITETLFLAEINHVICLKNLR